MEYFLDILKVIFYTIIVILIILGIDFIFCINDIATKLEYYQNDIKIDAIMYQNEIYLKKENSICF